MHDYTLEIGQRSTKITESATFELSILAYGLRTSPRVAQPPLHRLFVRRAAECPAGRQLTPCDRLARLDCSQAFPAPARKGIEVLDSARPGD